MYQPYVSIRSLLLILLFLSPSLTFSSCTVESASQVRNPGPFTGLKVGGAFDVVLNQSGEHKIVIEGSDEVIEKVRTEVKGDVLHIDMKRDWSWGDDDVTVYVDFDELESLHISGASNIRAETKVIADDLEIEVTGAGDIDLDVESKALEILVSGAGDVNLSGSTNTQNVRLSGAGDYQAQHLKSKYTTAKASGAGSVVVYASEEIEAYASGAGSVKYYGNPSKEKTDASGAGSISRR